MYQRNGHDEYYIEAHNVLNGKNGYHLGAGRPLSKKAMRRIIGTVAEQKIEKFTKSMLLPETLLQFSPLYHERHIVWYQPQKQYTLIFRKKKMKLWMPAMLYAVVFDQFFLFSLKSNKRPTPASRLYVAPVMNLIDSTKMCWGSVSTKHDLQAIDQEMNFWEDRLWNSAFAHIGSVCSKHEITSIYKDLERSGKKFPKAELIYTNMTLGQFIKDKLK